MRLPFYKNKNRLYIAFAFASLVVGVLSTLMISKYLLWEHQTDKCFANYDRIYFAAYQSSHLSEFMEMDLHKKVDYPHIEEEVNTKFYWEAKLEVNEHIFDGTCLVADSTFFKIFDYKLKTGDEQTILNNPQSLVLTSAMAKRLFGNENPIGKRAKLFTDNEIEYEVAGILEKPEGNITMQFDYIVPIHSTTDYWGQMGIQWIKLAEGASLNDLEALVQEKISAKKSEAKFKYVPLSEAYFDFNFQLMTAKHGSKKHLKLLLIIMVLVMGLSLFNFFAIYSLINTNRIKEFGVKKILGADSTQFTKAFFSEAVFICTLVFGISILIFAFLYPYFIQITGNIFTFSFKTDGLLLAGFFGFILILMVMWSLAYSAKISPLRIRRKYSDRKESLTPYKLVTILQYTITITLLIVTFSLFRQLNFMLNQDLNFSCENVISVNMFTELPYFSFETGEEAMEAYKKQRNQVGFVEEELMKSSLIENFSRGTSLFSLRRMGWKRKGEENYEDGRMLIGFTDYEKVFDFELTEGRFFNDTLDSNRDKKAVLNETAIRQFNIENIETDRLVHSAWGEFEIVGVVKNFKSEHLSRPTSPTIMLYWHDVERNWFIRLNKHRTQEAIAFVQNLHQQVAPNETFKYKFVQEELDAIYTNDRMQVKLYTILTALALFISIMGILALSLHHAFQRTKETGIRKVNGCTTIQATSEMLKPHAILVFVAFLISCGAGWYFVNEYLKNFAHKLPVNYLLFGIAGAIAVIISLITLFISLYKIASKNPIETIQTEQ